MFKKCPDENYKYVVAGNKVIALSSYGGKCVKGIAKCDPQDEFNIEYGKKLAAARCNEKVCHKRLRRAQQLHDCAYQFMKYWESEVQKYAKYEEDARTGYIYAYEELCEIEGNL